MRRIIQAGVGGMGLGWTDRVAESDQWEAAAYVDINKRNLMEAAQRHGMPKHRCFLSLEEALHVVEADALLDVTPQQSRRAICSQAFRHGLHVLSEKPLADSLPNAQAIVAEAAQQGRTFMVAQNYRYQPGPQTIKRAIERGRIGQLGYAGVSFHKGPHFGGFREAMPYPLVLDMSIHHVDLMRCIFGADIEAVNAASLSAPWNWNQGDATVSATLELTSGMLVNYFGSWVAAGAETSWNGDWRIEGAKGVLLWQNDDLFLSNKPARKTRLPLIKYSVTHQAYLLAAFAKALDSGDEPETSGRRNLNSLAATYAIVRAAEEHRQVRIEEMLTPRRAKRTRSTGL